jgi:hypothetical protein
MLAHLTHLAYIYVSFLYFSKYWSYNFLFWGEGGGGGVKLEALEKFAGPMQF